MNTCLFRKMEVNKLKPTTLCIWSYRRIWWTSTLSNSLCFQPRPSPTTYIHDRETGHSSSHSSEYSHSHLTKIRRSTIHPLISSLTSLSPTSSLFLIPLIILYSSTHISTIIINIFIYCIIPSQKILIIITNSNILFILHPIPLSIYEYYYSIIRLISPYIYLNKSIHNYHLILITLISLLIITISPIIKLV